jgi:hypothetical protein
MNDHERFTKLMKQTLDILRAVIEKLDVPLVEKDKLSGLVRNLTEYSYQAGRAERFSDLRPHEAQAVFRYVKEFGDSIKMEPQILKLVLDGLMEDRSWHNNTVAHFERVMSDGSVLLLWIAEEDRADREDELVPRYAVELTGPEGTADASRELLLATEDTDETCRFVRERIEADLSFSRKADGKMH